MHWKFVLLLASSVTAIGSTLFTATSLTFSMPAARVPTLMPKTTRICAEARDLMHPSGIDPDRDAVVPSRRGAQNSSPSTEIFLAKIFLDLNKDRTPRLTL